MNSRHSRSVAGSLEGKRIAANVVDGFINHGGHLKFSSERATFVPNFLERCRGQVSFDFEYEEVETIGVVGPDRSLRGIFTGGVRRRLSVTMRAGGAFLFVVNHVDRISNALQDLIEARQDGRRQD